MKSFRSRTGCRVALTAAALAVTWGCVMVRPATVSYTGAGSSGAHAQRTMWPAMMVDPEVMPAKVFAGERATLCVKVIDTRGVIELVCAKVTEYPEVSVELNDDGKEGDEVDGDGIWSGTIEIPAEYPPAVLNWDFLASDFFEPITSIRAAATLEIVSRATASDIHTPAPDTLPPPMRRAEPFVWQPRELNQLWMLCVGITSYNHDSVPAIPYARQDAELVREWFVSEHGASVPAGNLRVLCDEQATKENLLSQIDWLRRHAMPEDLVVVYIACHGAPEVAPDGQSVDAKYLVLYDTDPSNLFATGMPLEDLTRKLDLIDANMQVVILETCYAGPVGERILDKVSTADLEVRPRMIQDMGTRKGRIILTASSGRQVAIATDEIEGEEINGGIFTHYLLKALGDGHKRLVKDCFEEAWNRTRRSARLVGSTQEPQMFGDANVDVVFGQEH